MVDALRARQMAVISRELADLAVCAGRAHTPVALLAWAAGSDALQVVLTSHNPNQSPLFVPG